MPEARYNVVYRGKLLPDVDISVVKSKLMATFPPQRKTGGYDTEEQAGCAQERCGRGNRQTVGYGAEARRHGHHAHKESCRNGHGQFGALAAGTFRRKAGRAGTRGEETGGQRGRHAD